MVSRIIVGVVAAALAAVLLLSDRPWHLTDRPRIVEFGTLPEAPQTQRLRYQNEWLAAGIVPFDHQGKAPPADARPPLKVGWAYRETSLLRMPFWAFTYGGYVTYLATPQGWRVAAVQDGELERIEEMIGRDISGYEFPWYRYLWGWFLPLGFFAWWIAYRRERGEDEGYYR